MSMQTINITPRLFIGKQLYNLLSEGLMMHSVM